MIWFPKTTLFTSIMNRCQHRFLERYLGSTVHSVRASVTVTEAPASVANTEATEDEQTEDF